MSLAQTHVTTACAAGMFVLSLHHCGDLFSVQPPTVSSVRSIPASSSRLSWTTNLILPDNTVVP